MRDIYEWFDDLVIFPIGKAGMLLFGKLGYADETDDAIVSECKAFRLIYPLLPEDRLLNDLDRLHMKSVKQAAHLFDFGHTDFPYESENISFFAVDMVDVGSARTTEAYGIHLLLSKCIDTRSALFVRHLGSIMLSFSRRTDDGAISLYLSDWIAPESEDDGLFERAHVSSASLESAVDCFDGFAFEAMRNYYKYPMSYPAAWYTCLFDSLNTDRDISFPVYYSRVEMLDKIGSLMLEAFDQ